ncbi:MAG: serine/threonine protein kinase [Nannocystis sp.]|nr:serine/threonine protein kinase [Nannocystis sp.]
MVERSEIGPSADHSSERSAPRPAAADSITVRLGSSGPRAEDIVDSISALLRADDGGPLKIGRFAILSVLGQGGMGIVFSGFDEELDRRVAIKLVRRQADDELRYRERTLREAQALARLSHPNVVHVYEVGEHGGQVFVAMEFIHGQTLRQWLNEAPRPWHEVLAMFIQAGRGLAAAHAAGLVHRDFKPQNVLVGRDGRARVLDFGLASRSDAELAAPESSAALRRDLSTVDLLSVELTATGMTLGTPAYMSPEQHERGTIDARSDQFSFCVALYEGLFGERPFIGGTHKEIAAAVVRGDVNEPPAGSRVPSAVRRAILRGLAPTPGDRWPSMDALLAQLERRPAHRRVYLIAALGLLLASAAIAAAIAWPRGAVTCGGGAELSEAAWGRAQRAAVERAILGSGLAYAADTWTRVDAELSRYISEWAALYGEGCRTRQRGEISDDLHDRQVACLGQRRQGFVALVDVLTRADATAVQSAVDAVGGLQSLTRCGDLAALQSDVELTPDPQLVPAIERERDALARARALRDTRVLDAAGRELDGVVERARALAFAPLLIDALHQQGVVRKRLGEHDRAEASLIEAYQRADELGQGLARVEVTAELVEVVGYHQARPGEALVWALIGEAAARGQGGADEARARLLNSVGMVLAAQERREEARERYLESLAIHERTGAAASPERARVLNNLGHTFYADDALDEAAASYQRALAIYEAVLGDRHPDVAGPLNNLGNVAVSRGRRAGADAAQASAHYAAARGYYERALAIYESAHGREHQLVAFPLLNLGDIDFIEGRYSDADARYARALAIRAARYDAAHPLLASPLSNLGLTALKAGEPARARGLLARALAIREQSASNPLELAENRFALARALWDAASPAEETADRERARELALDARAGFASAEYTEELDEIDAWLREHPQAAAPARAPGRAPSLRP